MNFYTKNNKHYKVFNYYLHKTNIGNYKEL